MSVGVPERGDIAPGLDSPAWWPNGSPPMPGREVTGPQAWYGADMAETDEWIHTLSAAEIAEIDAALEAVKDRTDDLLDVAKEDFPLPTFGPAIEDLRHKILFGGGFALVRGLDIERYTKREAAMIFWGVGRHLGEPRSQNDKGDLLGHVRDVGYDVGNPAHRGYQTTVELTHHTDSTDIAGLMCLRPARSGGQSSLVSSTTIHNEMLRRRPDLLEELFRPFYVDRRRKFPKASSPTTSCPCSTGTRASSPDSTPGSRSRSPRGIPAYRS